MKLTLLVCGKLKPGPEAELTDDYLRRAEIQGRQLGLSKVHCRQMPLRAAISQNQIGDQALAASAGAERRIVLDETGRQMNSQSFASQINQWREQGIREACLMIGPADGWSQSVRDKGDLVLSLGKMTWPHKLVHAMAAEQIYRAISILTHSPYHRGHE